MKTLQTLEAIEVIIQEARRVNLPRPRGFIDEIDDYLDAAMKDEEFVG